MPPFFFFSPFLSLSLYFLFRYQRSNPKRAKTHYASCTGLQRAVSSAAIQFPVCARIVTRARPWEDQLKGSPWHSSPRLGSFRRAPGCIMDRVHIFESIKERERARVRARVHFSSSFLLWLLFFFIFLFFSYLLSLSPLRATVFSPCERPLLATDVFLAHHPAVYPRSLRPRRDEKVHRPFDVISRAKVARTPPQNDLRKDNLVDRRFVRVHAATFAGNDRSTEIGRLFACFSLPFLSQNRRVFIYAVGKTK